ncbi:MAG: hypothetical protein R3E79_53730 [Caldilineaceae bacterium]
MGQSHSAAGGFSIAFAGLRRTGKTAILHRAFNRLFTEQERVMPVFITFEPYLYRMKMITTYEVAWELFTGYLRSFLAFRHRSPELHRKIAGLQQLRQFATDAQDEIALKLFDEYDLLLSNDLTRRPSLDQCEWAIHMPRATAGIYQIPTAVFIDEFQLLADVYDPIRIEFCPSPTIIKALRIVDCAPGCHRVVGFASVGARHQWGFVWPLEDARVGAADRGPRG